MQHVPNDQRLEHVQFEVTVASTHSDSSVVAHDLSADHRDGLALSGVDLSRHDGAARLVLGKRELTETAARTRSQESNIVSDLHQAASERVKSTVKVDESVLGSQTFELVRSCVEVVAGILLEVFADGLSKTDVGVETSTDSSAALSDLVHILKRLDDALLSLLELVDVGAKLLAESQRSGILGVRATNLYDVVELVALGSEGVLETTELGQKDLVHFHNCSNVHH